MIYVSRHFQSSVNFKKLCLSNIAFRIILTGLGFLDGNWEELKEKASRVTLIEPLVEAMMQLTVQFLILLAILPAIFNKGDRNNIIKIVNN